MRCELASHLKNGDMHDMPHMICPLVIEIGQKGRRCAPNGVVSLSSAIGASRNVFGRARPMPA